MPHNPSVAELQEFRDLLSYWRDMPGSDRIRSEINRRVQKVQRAVQRAGCFRTFSLTPTSGGVAVPNINAFGHIFSPVFGHSLNDELVDMVEQAIGVIERDEIPEASDVRVPGRALSRKVFVVHGHDEVARETTARFLEKLGLEAIILHEQASGARTIIEKFERHADVAFAVVLLTPDDVGAARADAATLKPRARQNVILELGYFMGRLGRDRVTALLKDSLEKPSDYDGVVYIRMDDAGGWKQQLIKELRLAGLELDLSRVF